MFKKEKVLTLAGLTLRIAWLYRDKGVEDEEKRFLTIARNSIMLRIQKVILLEHKCQKRRFCI